MLDRIEKEGWLQPKAVFQAFPANSAGDDILIYESEERDEVQARDPLPSATGIKVGKFVEYLFVRLFGPIGTADWLGAFCVTAGRSR